MISIRFALNPRFSRISKLFLVCIMLIAFGGVLQAKAEEPVLIMAEGPVPIMVEQLAVGEAAGAEDVAIDAQGRIYGGMADGRIIRYQPDGSQPEVLADTEGRPLGLAFDADGNLIVADADKGLLSVSPDGAITVLSTEEGGVPYGLPNDVDVAEDGTIYFSDSSFKISLADALTELQEAPGPYGRLLKYDPETQTTNLVLGDLWFANGVAVSPDQSFVLVVEMAENRIVRYWLTGPDAGQSDIFVENLPVWPDGVSSNGQDTFWVAVLGEGFALGLDLDGNVVHNLHPLYPSGEPYAAVASVEEYEGMIYLGHLEDDFIPRLTLEKIATVETLETNKAIVRRSYEEMLNQRNLSLVDEFYAADFVSHMAGNPDIHGAEGFKQFLAMLFVAFPDIHWTLEDIFAEGDEVVTRSTVLGTHQGEFMGAPPTGRQMMWTAIIINRLENGKFVEDWCNADFLGLMQQLGVIPPVGNENYTWGEPSEVTGAPGNTEENKAILRRVVDEVLNQKNLDLVDEFYATDYVNHLPPNPEIRGSEGFKQFFAMQFAAFPDFHLTAEDVLAEGDKVVLRWTFTGTHEGELMGIPPTGKQVTYTGIVINRFADGKIVEDWEIADFLGMMQQLTAPPPVDTEANKAVVRRAYEEVTNQGNLDVVDEIFATDYVFHLAGMPDVHGPEGMKQFVAMLRAAFPELHETVEDIIAEGDMVASRVTVNYGAHQGEFIGIPPTGNQATATMMVIHRITSGKIVEDWGVCDTLGLMQQIGVIPPDREDFSWGVPSEVTGEPGDPEVNKAILRRIDEEALNQKNLSLVDDFYATDYVYHLPGAPDIRGSEGFKQYFSTIFAAFPDFHITIEDMFAEGGKVVSRMTIQGTHTGEFMGIPPTGIQFTTTGILINRFADGKIVEDWESFDFLGFMQQLGVIPPMVKDFSNVFFMPLTPGLNMVSLPLEPQTPYTARSFAEKLSATTVITLDEARQKFMGFTLDAPDDGFQIEGGKGYIVNAPEGGMVAFTGAAWTRPPMPAPEVRDFDYPLKLMALGHLWSAEDLRKIHKLPKSPKTSEVFIS